MFKKTLLCGLAVLGLLAVEAQSIKTPAASPTQTLKQDLGIGTVELYYSRPAVKGRKIFGDLVPFGQVWRTGANQATTLTFSDEVVIGGKKIAAGKYGFLTIPDKSEWTLILTKQLDVTSPAAYKQESDVVRVKAKTATTAAPVESFTIQFANVKPTGADLQVMWDNTSVSLPIDTDIDRKVMTQITDVMTKDNRPYYQAGLYYLENGKDLNQALSWLDKAVDQQVLEGSSR